MKTISPIEHEVNQIRLALYEKTKDMTPAQRAERTNRIADAAAKKYGFKIIESAKERTQ
jgi:hypothetical protein